MQEECPQIWATTGAARWWLEEEVGVWQVCWQEAEGVKRLFLPYMCPHHFCGLYLQPWATCGSLYPHPPTCVDVPRRTRSSLSFMDQGHHQPSPPARYTHLHGKCPWDWHWASDTWALLLIVCYSFLATLVLLQCFCVLLRCHSWQSATAHLMTWAHLWVGTWLSSSGQVLQMRSPQSDHGSTHWSNDWNEDNIIDIYGSDAPSLEMIMGLCACTCQ